MTLIVEPHSSGHRLHYVGFLIEECNSRGDRVAILTTRAAVESPEWRIHLGGFNPEVILRSPSAFSLPEIARVAAGLRAEFTIVPDGDAQIPAVLMQGWSGPGRFAMLVMRSDVQSGPPLAWMRPAKTLLKRLMIMGANIRSGVRVYNLRSPLVTRRGPLRWVPEPVRLSTSSEQVRAVREQLGDEGRYWLGVFGHITARKNLPLILDAISGMPDVGLLIAGPVDPEVSNAIAPLVAKFAANGGRLEQLGGPLTDAEFDSAIVAVDCVIAAHSNEGPSGVVLKAAASGRRLVLAGAKSLRQDAASLGQQATWSPLDANALRQAIRQARALPEPVATVDPGADEFARALTGNSGWP